MCQISVVISLLSTSEHNHLLDAQGEVVGKQIDLLQGTLEMLILKAVWLGPLHGNGVLLRIQQIFGEQLEIQQGSLYRFVSLQAFSG